MDITILKLRCKTGARSSGRTIERGAAIGYIVCTSAAAADLITRTLPQQALTICEVVRGGRELLLDDDQVIEALQHALNDALRVREAAERDGDDEAIEVAQADIDALVAEIRDMAPVVLDPDETGGNGEGGSNSDETGGNGEGDGNPDEGDGPDQRLDHLFTGHESWRDPLVTAGFDTLERIASAEPADLDAVEEAKGLGEVRAQKLIDHAKALLQGE